MPKIEQKTRVIIIQRRLTDYRNALFNLMRERLAAQGVQLCLLYGEPTMAEKTKNDQGDLALIPVGN